MQARQAHAHIRYETRTKRRDLGLIHARVTNPANLALMAKRKASGAKSKLKQRPRGEIDRNYFFGDVLRKTGAALWVALFLISAYTPFSWGQAQHNSANFGTVVAIFAVIGVGLYLYGRHLRREATHWEAD
jgi:hypothetical protein